LSESSTYAAKRPDFLCLLKDVLLFRGEEKSDLDEFDSAVEDLERKFKMIDPLSFGSIKYCICYAAAASIIRFYVLDGSSDGASLPSRLIPLTNKLDFTATRDRIIVIHTIINIIRIFVTIKDALPESPIPVGKRLKTNSSEIIFFDDFVMKKIPKDNLPYSEIMDDRIGFLCKMYMHAKGSIGLVQIKNIPKLKRRNYEVSLETRGYRHLPKDENELKTMTWCILMGLKRLHEGGYVHHDIRIPNIIYVPNNDCSPFVLIDFEDGDYSGKSVEKDLKDWDEGTLENDRVYTEQSDLYQFGKLLEKFDDLLSNEGKDFVTLLKGKQMMAENALRHPWIEKNK